MEKIVLFGICGMFLIMAVKKYSADYAVVLSVAVGAGILLSSIEYLSPVVSYVSEYSSALSVSSFDTTTLFKAIAYGYISQFAADVCRDAGESSLANKIETSAKMIIASLSIPALVKLFEYLGNIAGGL